MTTPRIATRSAAWLLASVALPSLLAAASPPAYRLLTFSPVETPQGPYSDVRFVALAEDDTLVGLARGARPPATTHPTFCKDFAVRYHPQRALEIIHEGNWKTHPMQADRAGVVYGMNGNQGGCKATDDEPRTPFRYRSAATGFEPLLEGADAAVRGSLLMTEVNSSGLIGGAVGFDVGTPPFPYLYKPGRGWIRLEDFHPAFNDAFGVPMVVTEKGEVGVILAREGGFQESLLIRPDDWVWGAGDLGYLVTTVQSIGRDGNLYGCARLQNTPVVVDHAFRTTIGAPIAEWITDIHVGAEWANSCVLATTARGALVGIAHRTPGSHATADFYLQRSGWGLHVLRDETLQGLVPSHMSYVGWTWIDTNAAQETVGAIQVIDPTQPLLLQARELPFYHHPRRGTFLLESLFQTEQAGRVARAFGINDAGTIAISFAVPQPAPQNDLALVALMLRVAAD